MLLILGCGRVGSLVAERWFHRGEVVGVRRSRQSEATNFLLVQGDCADDSFWNGLPHLIQARQLTWPPQAVLLSATPGLRRGRNHRLAAAAVLVHHHLPRARLVYTGSTAVYADAAGRGVDETAAVMDNDPAVAHLLDIEQSVLAHADSLVLRVPALVGPTRVHAAERLRSGERTVKGQLDRPFSILHEMDLAELCVDALNGGLGRGVLNAASPERLSAREYFTVLARSVGVPVPEGDGTLVPSRWIDATRLWRQLPERHWRHIGQES